MATLQHVWDTHAKNLELYVPVVARVHGQSHPEFLKVHSIFTSLVAKIKAAPNSRPDLTDEFAQLRSVTNTYTVPPDTCETYAAVYQMLRELDTAYTSQD
ncbi:MAG: iron-sulfur cluster repair di-iron protein, ric [Desulfovibrionales bacterium]|nr:iron-sulfur cluster repair di-iron protein, ric [Desulfovibrionales bacterium]